MIGKITRTTTSCHLLSILLLCASQFVKAATETPIAPLVCPEHAYNVQLFSTNPAILYISNFLSTDELNYLRTIDDTEFKASKVNLHKNSVEDAGAVQDTTRRSRSYVPPRDDVIQCIEQRAKSFQGHGQTAGRLERIQLVKYGISDEYKHHFDWADTPPEKAFDNRQTTFFAYVDTNCTGGGTNFPRLTAPENEKWCDVIDCDEQYAAGVTFKPIAGNAIFWQNLVKGVGHKDTYHAGLPVTQGTKMGMNIFSKERPYAT